MRAGFMQRLVAYLIDLVVISVAFSIVGLFIPNNNSELSLLNEKLGSAEEKMVSAMQKGDSVVYRDVLDDMLDIQYEISKKSVLNDSILLVITFLYFVVLQYILKGKTVGKIAMMIKVVDKKKKEPSMGVMLMRTFIVQGLLSSFIAIMTILFLDRKAYSLFNGGINMITGIFIIVCALMILYRKDKRGLHDIMAGSFVVKEEN